MKASSILPADLAGTTVNAVDNPAPSCLCTMSGRTEKSRSQKSTERDTTAERVRLSQYIELRGTDSQQDIMPCTPCFRRGTRCVMVGDKNRCSECTRRSRPCDGVFVGVSLERATTALDKVSAKELEADDALAEAQEKALAAHRDAVEALCRLTQLRKQKQLIRSKEKELFYRGMAELDQEDGVGELSSTDVTLLESEAVMNAHALGDSDVLDWTAVYSTVS